MLRLPPFRYLRATSAAEAAAMLASEGPDSRPVAGGTGLWPNLKRGQHQAGTVVGLAGIAGLCGMDQGRAGRELRVGATTDLATVASSALIHRRFPALSRAASSIASPALRNQGTLGGNLCLDTRCTYYDQPEHWRQAIGYCKKAAGEVCWVAPSSKRCWAHSAGDTAPVLCALGARLRLVSASTERVLPVAELFRDDGIDHLAKRHDEVVADILLPAAAQHAAGDRCHSAFWKLRRRGVIDFAVVSVAATVWFDGGGRVTRASIFLGAVASAPVAATEAAAALRGQPLDEETIGEAAHLARKVATPMDNTDLQAQWRRQMVEVYTAAALREIAGLDPGVAPPRHLM